MASSILYSSIGGRVVTLLPEPGTAHDSTTAQGACSESPDSEARSELISEDGSVHPLTHAGGPVAAFISGSEALDLSRCWPDLSGLPTNGRKYELGKRVFDVALAILISPMVALAMAAIGLLIALTSNGPIFFRQRRIGQHGREFMIWKFRTMHPRADRILAEYLKRNATAREEWSYAHKLRHDPRITRLGQFLRKTSLDELPQILNVFSGDMSFVGPRPIVRAESQKYAERFPYYLAAVPGITGLWQVSGRCDVSYEARTLLDETYVCKWSMLRDVWILLKTPRAVVYRNGAY